MLPLMLLPNTKKHVTSKQSDQKQHHDKHAQPCSLFPGSLVMIRDYTGPSKWIPGMILRKLGPVTFDVETTNGWIVKQHVDQLRFWKDWADDSEVKTLMCLIIINTHHPKIILYSKIHLCILSPRNIIIPKENAIHQIDLFPTMMGKWTPDRGKRCGILMDIITIVM